MVPFYQRYPLSDLQTPGNLGNPHELLPIVHKLSTFFRLCTCENRLSYLNNNGRSFFPPLFFTSVLFHAFSVPLSALNCGWRGFLKNGYSTLGAASFVSKFSLPRETHVSIQAKYYGYQRPVFFLRVLSFF